ncbi:RDD family protein [Salibacterium lacus]|uniref:RDD family protein n=1 Tax=Salibacterium lacus TaxID=1898109 RepID=A0ABW5T526_9BACI
MDMDERAGFWIRLGAILLDSLILGAVFSMMTWLIYGEFYREAWNITDLFSLLYLVLVPVFWHGYVIGKWLVGIRIVKDSGEDVTLITMVMREIVAWLIYVFTIGIGLIVSAFMVGLREDRKAIHDFIAGTYVTKTPARIRKEAEQSQPPADMIR